jgi:hypothetical protein
VAASPSFGLPSVPSGPLAAPGDIDSAPGAPPGRDAGDAVWAGALCRGGG